jgi:glycyl-tRNA synthetase
VVPSFEIYGGVAGLFDYGPLGCQLKGNVEALWKRHFVLEEDMLEVSCVSLTPDEVLKTSVSDLSFVISRIGPR